MLHLRKASRRNRNVIRIMVLIQCAMVTIGLIIYSAFVEAKASEEFTGDDIIRTAVTYLGTPYVLGGTSHTGIDCSGFVYCVLTELGFHNVPRTSAEWKNPPDIYYKGNPAEIQVFDAASREYNAQAGDVLSYDGHVAFSVGSGSLEEIKNYVASLGGNAGLVFCDYSGWPAEAPWYRIHARSAAPNAQGRISGIEIDNTNTGSYSGSYAAAAYRLTDKKMPQDDSSVQNENEVTNNSELPNESITQNNSELSNDSTLQNSAELSDETALQSNTVITGDVSNTEIIPSAENAPSEEIIPSAENTSSEEIRIKGSTKNSIIQNLQISEISTEGYRVTVTLNNSSNIISILFPTWTKLNEKDDITWHSAIIKRNKAVYYVKSSEHNNEKGSYVTQVYARDKYGNLNILEETIQIP